MCGIAGIWTYSSYTVVPDEELLRKMSAPMGYRGPDQEGFMLQSSDRSTIGLAHKRLSIIDLSESANQPMKSSDDRWSIVFNGEIYNYHELRNQCILEGYPFKTQSDTEVILAIVQLRGPEKLPELLMGMFAIGLFDHLEEQLFLYRDRFGEKPLYYSNQLGFTAFSSDIRSFYCLPISFEIDDYALGYYFSEMCTPVSNSIFKRIKKLEPGHFLTISREGIAEHCYWHPDYRSKQIRSEKEWIQAVEEQLESAVKACLVADVPVGTFLSGGIDSSLITLMAAKQYGRKISTFSVGFEHEGFNELPYASQVAQLADSDHHEIVLSIDDLPSIRNLLAEYGEPFADSSQIPTHYVAHFASKHVKVVLGGDGGDELFGGYRTYNQAWRMQQWYNIRGLAPFLQWTNKVVPTKKFTYLHGVMRRENKVLAEALQRSMGFSPEDVSKIDHRFLNFAPVLLEHEAQVTKASKYSNNPFDQLLYSSLKTRLVNDYLVKTDRATMFNSLELRSPFLHPTLFELVSKIPHNLLMKRGQNKYITYQIAKNHFGERFVNREKMGFGIPIGTWMRSGWKKPMEEILFTKFSSLPIEQHYVERIWKEHQTGQKDHSHRLWILYALNTWLLNQS
jgi:asparagine synthase (glutamine-hydrolysing)